MDWNEDLLKEKLTGKLIGHTLYYFPEIDSTNDEAFRLGVAGAPEGTVVIADSQTKGRGRMLRAWHSPAGSNIYTSLILRPCLKPSAAPQISLVAGVAVAEILEQYCPRKIALKWPNDILVGNKKICGILAQMKTVPEGIDFVVAGIGVNVNIREDQFPPEIRGIATSLSLAAGRKIAREDLIIGLYNNFAKWYRKLLQSGFISIKEQWLKSAPMIGQNIRICHLNETVTGKAIGINDTGSLILLTDRGETVVINAGEATILKEDV